MSYYIGDYTTRVYGPYERRKDGEWSKRMVIYAAFREEKEARVYAEIMKCAGVPTIVQLAPLRLRPEGRPGWAACSEDSAPPHDPTGPEEG